MFAAALCVIAWNWNFKCLSTSEQLIYTDKKSDHWLPRDNGYKQDSDGITKRHEETFGGDGSLTITILIRVTISQVNKYVQIYQITYFKCEFMSIFQLSYKNFIL